MWFIFYSGLQFLNLLDFQCPHLIVPGILGALTIVLSNLTVAEIGVALMVGISLLGQMITSLFIDGFGLLGKEKTPITVKQLISLFIIAIGVYFLL